MRADRGRRPRKPPEDVDGQIGAGRHERSAERRTCRNGYRDRDFDTRLGTLNLRIPKLRQGSYFPPFLESRKTSEKALVAVIQEAWIGGVSTRKVDEPAKAMGLSGISKSSVSRLCADIDERVDAFLNRPLEGEWPYLWLDATYIKQRQGGRIVAVAAIIAPGLRRGRLCRQHRRPPRDCRPAHRPVGSRGVLERFPEKTEGPRPSRGQIGDFRRPRRPESGDFPRHERHLATLPRALDAQRLRPRP